METRKSNLINGRSDVCTRVKLQNPELLRIYGTKVPDDGRPGARWVAKTLTWLDPYVAEGSRGHRKSHFMTQKGKSKTTQ